MRISASALAAYGRCPRQKLYSDMQRRGELDQPALQLSATAYGSVMHQAVQTMEQIHYEGGGQPLEVAQATFEHYWNPANISEICPPVDEWLPRQTYGGLRETGIRTLRDYYDLLKDDDGRLLGLEVEFNVPIMVDGVEHNLNGFIDRLVQRRFRSKRYISVEDYKSGKQKYHLRYDVQFTVYCYATTKQEFWQLWPDGDARWETYSTWARRGRWISLKDVKYVDAGWRGDQDYRRLELAIREYVRAVEAGIYPLTMAGDVCVYCPFREICGDVPVPDPDHGEPS